MRADWLWDRKTTPAKARRIFKNPDSPLFLTMAALLLARKNTPKEVFKDYMDPLIFCRYWPAIKRKMRQDKWTEPRIIFWQAIYEALAKKYHAKGVVFKSKKAVKKPVCENLGREIAALRREQNLSQKGLARKIGVSQQLISRIEKSGENLSLITLTNVARALNKRAEVSFVNL
jgi:DNA-binding XRE family transcriptional regulator